MSVSPATVSPGEPVPEPDDAGSLVRGVSPVLAVPFTATGDIDVDGFRRVVRYVLGTGVSSMMFPGFASEYYKLTEDERRTLTAVLLAETGPRADVAAIVAVQDHATRLVVARAREAVAAGADLINLLPPHFLSPSRRALVDHVRAVLDAVAPTPVVLQYAPTETGTSLDGATLAAIAAAHPNLRLVKVESSPPGRLIAELAALDPPLASIEGYAGVQLPDAIRRGAVGTQPGCSFTEIYVEIWRRFAEGDTAGGEDLHRRLLPYISYWMLDTELIIAAEKRISYRRGLIASDLCRGPAHELDAEERRVIDRFLAEFADLLPDLSG
ncbi:dihydrodipicolinate synthase family protein [Actinomadura viridis]|uniref:4-hydroxy-tetrahydrodipicolinate synthase n=1 Tax=Actinomadura viridis TaxID=58110 RepID=A0A931DIG7_9ACTN|nr:dihydrodipicolinate synthase family protein [Actinomadura viridis]MBG6088782.1 4-hydroxy-tetrahydrodipicolinate synthase [Actinomadura viridis]